MSLTLYFHPLSSFCHKVLIALYENATPFTPHVVDLMSETAFAAYRKIWPLGKIPVLRDAARDRTVPETSIIIEYLDRHFPGPIRFVPEDPDAARETRLRDRLFDLHVNVPMQKIVTDRLRPEGMHDPYGVDEARKLLAIAYDMIESEIGTKVWIMGDGFSMADCAAAPALFYANKVLPIGKAHRKVAQYFDRLLARPSYARVLEEAEPYLPLFPK